MLNIPEIIFALIFSEIILFQNIDDADIFCLFWIVEVSKYLLRPLLIIMLLIVPHFPIIIDLIIIINVIPNLTGLRRMGEAVE